MSSTFKPGDRVRHRVSNREYAVTAADSRGWVALEGYHGTYSAYSYELVAPASVEFQKGDRVRAKAKEGDDFAEFTVITANAYALYSDKHLFDRKGWDFELLARPVPPKPTNQEVWDSFPIGQRFHFGDAPTSHKVKVTEGKFYSLSGDSTHDIQGYLHFGVYPSELKS